MGSCRGYSKIMGRHKKRIRLKKVFTEPVFKSAVIFMAGYCIDDVHKWFKKVGFNLNRKNKLNTNDIGSVWSIPDSKYSHIVWIGDPEDYYTILHESIHLATTIMDEKGIPISKNNDEVLAYLSEFWTRIFWKYISKYT